MLFIGQPWHAVNMITFLKNNNETPSALAQKIDHQQTNLTHTDRHMDEPCSGRRNRQNKSLVFCSCMHNSNEVENSKLYYPLRLCECVSVSALHVFEYAYTIYLNEYVFLFHFLLFIFSFDLSSLSMSYCVGNLFNLFCSCVLPVRNIGSILSICMHAVCVCLNDSMLCGNTYKQCNACTRAKSVKT